MFPLYSATHKNGIREQGDIVAGGLVWTFVMNKQWQ